MQRISHVKFPNYSIDVTQPKLCDPSVKQVSGYLNVDADKHFFFWFFESRHTPASDPLLLWLNGGPGCSSLTGLFMELGPCSVDDTGNHTIHNPHSWNNRANIIFLDQPANVGFSYGAGTKTSDAAAGDVFVFLQLFLEAFQQYQGLPFHVFGESYGGHYVPAIGRVFRDRGREEDMIPIFLESVGIGNGLVDPLVQYKYYPDMACNSTYEPVLPESECSAMRNAYPTCAQLISPCYRFPNAFTCVPASIYCNQRVVGPYQKSGRNPYDVRKNCEGNDLCYPILSAIETYLNRPDVMAELGVQVDEYKSCNMQVNQDFFMAGDWMRPYHKEVAPLLAEGVKVLVYAGDADFICNWYGNKAWSLELEWMGKEHFNKEPDHDYLVKGKKVGEVRQGLGLVFLRMLEAGHMMPYDQPEASLDMINRWLSGKGFY
jgi:cathepsin A (carboxypeptidase C)